MNSQDEVYATSATDSPAQSPAGPQQRSQTQSQQETQSWPWLGETPGRLLAGLLFGVIFGFLLQKGGVAKFDILAGVLLLENFVVIKVMVSAIIVGMVGVYILERLGLVEPQISETKYGANIIGGLIFGVGFGLLAYCPGTCAAAVGQGNLDGLLGMAGLILGSYIFALSSRFSSGRISGLGNRGKITWPDLLSISKATFIAIAAPALILVLVLLEMLEG